MRLTFINDVCIFLIIIIISDVDVKRLYWMEFNTGDLRSSWENGSDVETIISTNATFQNKDIDIDGELIFYTNDNTIMKINKSLGHNPTVLHTDTTYINSLLVYKSEGKKVINTIK